MAVNESAGTATNLSADELDGKTSADFYAAGGKVADADAPDGKDSSEFAAASHPHAGEDIASGAGSEPRFDPALARDGEVVEPRTRAWPQ